MSTVQFSISATVQFSVSTYSYKVSIEGNDLPFDAIMEREKEFYVHPEDFEKKSVHNRMALFAIIDKTDSSILDLSNLLQHGMNGAPQGVLNLSHPIYSELLKYIEENF